MDSQGLAIKRNNKNNKRNNKNKLILMNIMIFKRRKAMIKPNNKLIIGYIKSIKFSFSKQNSTLYPELRKGISAFLIRYSMKRRGDQQPVF